MPDLKRLFAIAFEMWETEFRLNPSRFMTPEQSSAMDSLPLAEQRAEYFAAIIKDVEKTTPCRVILTVE